MVCTQREWHLKCFFLIPEVVPPSPPHHSELHLSICPHKLRSSFFSSSLLQRTAPPPPPSRLWHPTGLSSESLRRVWFFETSRTIQPMGFSRPEYWMGSLSLLQGIFPTQGSSLGLLHCRQILYQLSHRGSPRILEWVAYPFSRGSSWARNRMVVFSIAGRFFTNWAVRVSWGPAQMPPSAWSGLSSASFQKGPHVLLYDSHVLDTLTILALSSVGQYNVFNFLCCTRCRIRAKIQRKPKI